MGSHIQSIKFPGNLAEAAKLRANALGYKSWNAYMKALVRYDLLVQGSHDLTLPLSEASGEKQDAVDMKLLELTKRGVGQRGQLLKRIVERAQQKDQTLMDSLLEEAEG